MKISRRMALLAFLIAGTLTAEDAQVLWEIILWAVGTHRVGNRPNRYEPRSVKRHEKGYNRLTIPREEARKRLRKRVKECSKTR